MKIRSKSPKNKQGFTIVEVMLSLAITAALFAAILGTSVANIYRSRYNDSVNDIVDRLRSVYSAVINTEIDRTGSASSNAYCSISSVSVSGSIAPNSGSPTYFDNYPGRSGCAVYGKLVTIGESSSRGDDNIDGNMIRVYDVIGTIRDKDITVGNDSSDFSNERNAENRNKVLAALSTVGANVLTINTNSSRCGLTYAGQYEEYSPLWQARLEKTSSNDVLKAAFLVVRSPLTGGVHTYIYRANATIEVQDFRLNHDTPGAGGACNSTFVGANINELIKKAIDNNDFSDASNRRIDLCVGSDDTMAYGGKRRNIRILPEGQNTSAISLTNMDSEDNPCK